MTLNWSTADGTATAGSDYVAASGQVTFLPAGGNTQTITVSVNGDLTAEATETFFVNLSARLRQRSPRRRATAQGTILDNDTTKFYVVNDGSPDRTYEYGAAGNAVENYALNSGNTAPRGAASTAAGDKVWVVDANKKVYVYNTSGGLLGSWTAGSLTANAQVEGIATNGTDIWIVDAKQDKVFKYTGAASRLSGSQNAASSFSLNSGNTNPKDIVTDGTSLWVVNDGTTDKVFKYTLAGSLLGQLDHRRRPTPARPASRIDPANVSDIWIVDSGTDRVYQYTAAASRTSGSQTASRDLRPGRRQHQPAGHRRPAAPVSAPAGEHGERGRAADPLARESRPPHRAGGHNPVRVELAAGGRLRLRPDRRHHPPPQGDPILTNDTPVRTPRPEACGRGSVLHRPDQGRRVGRVISIWS